MPLTPRAIASTSSSLEIQTANLRCASLARCHPPGKIGAGNADHKAYKHRNGTNRTSRDVGADEDVLWLHCRNKRADADAQASVPSNKSCKTRINFLK